MNRRELVTEGLRYLAQALPMMVSTAGSLGVLLRRGPEGEIDQRAACFPAQREEVAQPTATPLPKED
jgi:hypothetical protein